MKVLSFSLFPLTFTLALGPIPHPALSAAERSSDNTQAAELEAYVVTGSHFTKADQLVDFPLTEIDHESLRLWNEQSAYTALLDQPFTYGYANSDTQSNGLTGSAGANLRGLGNLNTLTLINGRRAGGNSAVGFEQGGFADLNLTPIAAIREIEVVTEGTSVTYGADAVAGTVNLLLWDDFTGNRTDASYRNTTDGDATEKSLSFLTGQQLSERTHLVLVGSWYERNAIYARDRAISKNADFTDQGGTDQRSDTFSGRIEVDGQNFALKEGRSAPDPLTPFLSDYTTDYQGFNYNKFAPAIPARDQRSAMAHFSHDLSDQVEFWTSLLYSETEFHNGLAPAPWRSIYYPGLTARIAQSPHSPLTSGQNLNELRYRNLVLGNLEGLQEKSASRLLIGLRGEIDRWDWEAAAMGIKSDLDVTRSGLLDESKLTESIMNGSFNPFAESFATGTTGTVSYDNASALRAAETSAEESFEEDFLSFDMKAGGPVFELPSGDIRVLLGTEFRKEEVNVDVDHSINFDEVFFNGSNGALGFFSGATPYKAKRSVFSLFGESLIPIFENLGKEDTSLNAQLAFRYDDYTDKSDGLENKYHQLVHKAGLTFKPSDTITFEASWSTAFRTPTLNESFNSSFASLTYDVGTPDAPEYQLIDTWLDANPDLDPEKSDSFNFSISYEPTSMPGLRVQANYYRVETDGAINHNGQELVEANRFNSFGGIDAVRFNTANVFTDGIEYEFRYLYTKGQDSWEFSLGLNQILHYEVQANEDSETIDFLGRLVHPLTPSSENVQGPGSIPEYKGYARLLWNRGGLTLGGTIHYIHSLDDNAIATGNGNSRKIDPWTSLDLVAQYAWSANENGWLSGTTVRLGVENVTDKAPPFAAGAFADGYDSSLYSLAGRRFSLSASKAF